MLPPKVKYEAMVFRDHCYADDDGDDDVEGEGEGEDVGLQLSRSPRT